MQTETVDSRRPAFSGLNSKQRQHRRQHVVIGEVPAIPNSLLHCRKLVSIFVLKVFAPDNT